MPQQSSNTMRRPRHFKSANTRRFSRPRKSAPKKENIHHSRFIQAARPQKVDVYDAKHTFQDLNMAQILKDNLASMGYETPSPIQDQAIPLALSGRDIVGIANTGTGKTAAFMIPVVDKLINNPSSKAIILAPTRELAQQIEDQCRQIAKGTGLIGTVLIGGSSMRQQLQELSYNPQIVIGTPGRVKDHLERRTLDISKCDTVVLDEVDRMLDMGFVADIREIVGATPDSRQNLYFSATLDARVSGIIKSFSHDPAQISVKSSETSHNVEQDVVRYNASDSKIDKLHELLIDDTVGKAIIFDDTQRSVDKLSKELTARGFAVDSIHGGKTQGQRQRVLQKFKKSQLNVLVATDVAARGIDISDITHVVNYSQPQAYDDYVHRIGRTGRAGKTGYAYTFVKA
jgi:ATP-dependent RNA helicase RhlE